MAWKPLGCLVLFCLIDTGALATTPMDSAPTQQTFKVGALPFPCSWINTPKAFELLPGQAFSITAGPATDLYNGLDDGSRAASAPMLAMAADPAFVLTATVRVAFRKEYDGGFLVLFADPDHWVKLLFEKSHYGPYSVCSNVTNGGTDDNVHHDVQGQEVRLRITRSGDLFTLYSSLDGSHWTYLRLFRFAVKGALRQGFGAQSPVGEACTATFMGIHYSPKASLDFWSGAPAK